MTPLRPYYFTSISVGHKPNTDNFERGMTDTFEVEATVGDIKYIRIGHDNSGFGPSWHLQEVILSSPSIPDLQFVANRCVRMPPLRAFTSRSCATSSVDTLLSHCCMSAGNISVR